LARLLANLIAPAPEASILDARCGNGEILLACHLAQAEGVQLFGQEPDAATLTFAAQRLQQHGIIDASMLTADALHQPLLGQNCQLQRFDHVISWIPANQGVWYQSWAERDRFRRFPAGPPEARELAQIWHNIACLNPTGSMALLVPGTVLNTQESYSLRQYLARNWLEGAIAVPAALWPEAQTPLVILLCQRNSKRQHMALIRPDASSSLAYCADTILAAWWAHQHDHAHACLQAVTHDRLKAQRYSLDWCEYRAGAEAMRQPAPATPATATPAPLPGNSGNLALLPNA
jgi:type I restriction-modification system DNA methylase subunit